MQSLRTAPQAVSPSPWQQTPAMTLLLAWTASLLQPRRRPRHQWMPRPCAGTVTCSGPGGSSTATCKLHAPPHRQHRAVTCRYTRSTRNSVTGQPSLTRVSSGVRSGDCSSSARKRELRHESQDQHKIGPSLQLQSVLQRRLAHSLACRSTGRCAAIRRVRVANCKLCVIAGACARVECRWADFASNSSPAALCAWICSALTPFLASTIGVW